MGSPCWIVVGDEDGYHYPSRAGALPHAAAAGVRKLAVPCAGGAKCQMCGGRYDDDPGTHYPSDETAAETAESGGWYRIGLDVWCWECQQDSPEVVDHRDRVEREAASTRLPGMEEI